MNNKRKYKKFVTVKLKPLIGQMWITNYFKNKETNWILLSIIIFLKKKSHKLVCSQQLKVVRWFQWPCNYRIIKRKKKYYFMCSTISVTCRSWQHIAHPRGVMNCIKMNCEDMGGGGGIRSPQKTDKPVTLTSEHSQQLFLSLSLNFLPICHLFFSLKSTCLNNSSFF